jgi:hypothetical protein
MLMVGSFNGHGKTPPMVRVEASTTVVVKNDNKGTTGGLSVFSKGEVESSDVDGSSVLGSSSAFFSASNAGVTE